MVAQDSYVFLHPRNLFHYHHLYADIIHWLTTQMTDIPGRGSECWAPVMLTRTRADKARKEEP